MSAGDKRTEGGCEGAGCDKHGSEADKGRKSEGRKGEGEECEGSEDESSEGECECSEGEYSGVGGNKSSGSEITKNAAHMSDQIGEAVEGEDCVIEANAIVGWGLLSGGSAVEREGCDRDGDTAGHNMCEA